MNLNILLLIVIIFMVVKIADGYKRGMVKEVISFVSLVIMCIVVLLLGTALHSYLEKEIIGVIVAVLLLVILGITHHLLRLVFFSAKLVSKLPIVSSVDKLLGMVAGAAEVILILWTVYTFIMYFQMGTIGNLILEYSRDSKILTGLYEYNMLASIVEKILTKIM